MDDGSVLHEDLRDRLMRIVELPAQAFALPDEDAGSWLACGWPLVPDHAPAGVGGRLRTGQREPRSDETARVPDLVGLTASLRQRLADEWLQDGLYEHASIAWFSRLSMGLLAVGAPAELVHRAYDAAGDEARHSQLCFALASGYQGESVGPSAYPFEEAVPIAGSMEGLATATFEQGCIGETLAAIQIREQLLRAQDVAVCATLEEMASDEARHAELTWEVLAWTVHRGGVEVARAIGDILGRASWVPDASDAASAELRRMMMAHGRLDPFAIHVLQARGLRSVIVPCAQRLLAPPVADVEPRSGWEDENTAIRRRS